MILAIFFAILLGMMAGLTILVSNLQGILETLLVYILLFWESKSMRALLRKNLGAHKQRNFLTSIIYSLTLGCIIFLLVTANLEIQSIAATHEIENADIYLRGKHRDLVPLNLDPILMKHKDQIKDFGFISDKVSKYQASHAHDPQIKWSDRAKISNHVVSTYGLGEGKIIDESFVADYQKSNTTLGLTEQLFTARG